MTAIPEFILKKLIVQKSYKRTSSSFSFIIRNSFAPGNLTAFSISSDGKLINNELVTLQGEGQEIRKSSAISIENPFPLSMGLSVTINAQNAIPGKKITIQANTRELGAIDFSFSPKGLKSRRQRKLSYPLLKRWTAKIMHSDIKIDRSKVIGKINPYIYGHFIEHLERCIYDGIWTKDGKELRQDTFELIKALKPSIIRYPGGNFASGYHWQDGIGPKEQRPKRFDAAWQAPESNQVGTDEYMDFVRKLGCNPLLVVNDGSGTAEEAAHWVAYCNQPASGEWGKIRAANGHTDPHNVNIWGVGNEVWGAWQIGTTSAEEYAKRLIKFSKAMRKEDPTIKIVAVGNTPLTDDPYEPATKWNEIVLSQASEYFNYLSWHIYQPDQTAWQAEPEVEKLHQIVSGAPLDVEEIIHRVDRQILKYAKKKPILQAVDEWNLWLTPPENAKSMHGLMYNMRDALYCAGMLNVFHRQCNSLEMTNIAQLVNVLPLIITTPEIAYTTAMYFPFLMYTRMLEFALHVETQSPEFESDAMGGNIAAKKKVPYLDVTATMNSDQTKLVLGLINRHPYRRMKIQILADGWSRLDSVSSLVLTGNPLDANTLKNPNKLKISKTEKPSLLSALPPCSVTLWEFDSR
jgi:alpha-N-arabinofuranosidase